MKAGKEEGGTGGFPSPFIPCRKQLSRSMRETARYKLQQRFRLTTRIIISSDTKAALFLSYNRTVANRLYGRWKNIIQRYLENCPD